MEWIADPNVWLSLLTLTILEIVLGIDNLIFLAILAGRLPPERQLALTFDAARSTVRRALDQLEKAGLVSRRLGSGSAPPCAPQERPHPRHQLTHAEGLRQVVVRPHLQPHDTVQLLALRREHEDRHVGVRAQAPADLEPVHLRQHQVEHDHVGTGSAHLGERRGAIVGTPDLIPITLEVHLDKLDDVLVVVHDQHTTPGHDPAPP